MTRKQSEALVKRFKRLSERTPEQIAKAQEVFRAEFGKPATLRNRQLAAAHTGCLLAITNGLPARDHNRARALRMQRIIQEAAP